MKLIDLTGKRFGRLTVLGRDGTYVSPKGAKSVTWLCKCDCGKEVSVTRGSLKNGFTLSCGCYRKDCKKVINPFFIDGDVAHIIIKDSEFLIDKEDIPKISGESYYIGNNGYAARNKDRKLVHRLLTNAPDNSVVDHINGNKLDNRKANLRVVNASINGINKRMKPGKSGEQFITLNKRGYYLVYVDGKYIGCSRDKEKAVDMRNKALVGSRVETYRRQLQEDTHYL